MPRLFRESPLNSIWEGSGNVQCLDVLRAMVKSPPAVDAFFAEVAEGAAAEPRLAAFSAGLRDEVPGDVAHDRDPGAAGGRTDGPRSSRARCWSATATRRLPDAFCASRLDGDWGRAFGDASSGPRLPPHHRAPRARRLTPSAPAPPPRRRPFAFIRDIGG